MRDRLLSRHGANAFFLAPLLATLIALALAGTWERDGNSAAERSSGSIYWGAWIDGGHYPSADRQGLRDAPWGYPAWDRFERNAGGKRVSILHFGQPAPWEQPFSRHPFELVRERGAIALLDMDTADAARDSGRRVTLREVASGARDRQLRRWSRAAARYGAPFFFRLNWEMNGRWFDWGREAARDPAVYVAAWRRFHRIAERAGARNITWVWCPNVIFEGSTPLSELYPGDRYVDWTCMDGYNRGRHPNHPASWRSFAELFGPTYDALLALAPDKPIMIAEVGSTEVDRGGPSPQAKARWITEALADLPRRFPRVEAFAWFNWNILERGNARRWDWQIESSAAARRAFARGIAAPYFAGNRFGELPRHSRIEPLP